MTPTQARTLGDHVDRELAAGRTARSSGDTTTAWAALERGHVPSQPLLGPHLRVHAAMLVLVLVTRDAREAVGQAARLALAPLGALTGRLPWGNSGRSSVNPFVSAPIPADLPPLLKAAGVRAATPSRTSDRRSWKRPFPISSDGPKSIAPSRFEMRYCNLGASSSYIAASTALRASKAGDDCLGLNNVYMGRVIIARSTLVRACARLWAALALACVLSLAMTSVASAMDATAELAVPAPLTVVAPAPDAAVAIDATGPEKHQSPTKGHCALCCLHACSSLAPATATLPASIVAADALHHRLDTVLTSGSPSTQDQPPRA